MYMCTINLKSISRRYNRSTEVYMWNVMPDRRVHLTLKKKSYCTDTLEAWLVECVCVCVQLQCAEMYMYDSSFRLNIYLAASINNFCER